MASTPRFQFQEGTSSYNTYKWMGWGLFVLGVFLIAVAYSETAGITILDNDYNISLPRITKAVSFMVAILGLQVVAGFTGQ
jgi:branched-chain amino acid transport system permease protein